MRAGDKTYALRLNRAIRAMNDQSRVEQLEKTLSETLNTTEVSPKVYSITKEFSMMEFLNGHTVTPDDLRSAEILKKIVYRIKELHSADISSFSSQIAPLDPFELLSKSFNSNSFNIADSEFEHRVNSVFNTVLDTYIELCTKVHEIYEECLIHNDIARRNILRVGDEIKLIDFDRVKKGSPLIDLANLSLEYDSVKTKELVLKTYYSTCTPELLKMLSVYENFSLLTSLYISHMNKAESAALHYLEKLEKRVELNQRIIKSQIGEAQGLSGVPLDIKYIVDALEENNYKVDAKMEQWVRRLLYTFPSIDTDVFMTAVARNVATLLLPKSKAIEVLDGFSNILKNIEAATQTANIEENADIAHNRTRTAVLDENRELVWKN